MYNLELLGKARTRLSKQHKQQLQDAKRQKGGSGDRVESTIEVDTEMAELQVGEGLPLFWPNRHCVFPLPNTGAAASPIRAAAAAPAQAQTGVMLVHQSFQHILVCRHVLTHTARAV